MFRLLVFPFLVVSGTALAQVTGTVNPTTPPDQSPATEDVPPGGCMPMGITAAGEVVFPFQCKAFLEQHRGKEANQQPAVADEKPVLDEAPSTAVQKPAAVDELPIKKKPQAAALEKSRSVDTPARAAPLSKRDGSGPRESVGCTYYRSYDPASGTYLGLSGQRHSCP